MIKVWNKKGNHLLNIDVNGKTIAKNLTDNEAKEIVNQYMKQGYKLENNIITMLWSMSKEEKISATKAFL